MYKKRTWRSSAYEDEEGAVILLKMLQDKNFKENKFVCWSINITDPNKYKQWTTPNLKEMD